MRSAVRSNPAAGYAIPPTPIDQEVLSIAAKCLQDKVGVREQSLCMRGALAVSSEGGARISESDTED